MASSGVNVKMGVSGVAQFKQAMNQSKQAVKTLDAELALSEKQFKASGDAETYAAEKAELLQKKLEEQKSVVANAEKALEQMRTNGVDKASTAYQTMQRDLLNAKASLIDIQNQMDGVEAAGEDAAEGVSDMNLQLAAIGDGVSYQNVTDGLSKITGGLENIIKKAWQAGEALVRATLGAGSWADELATTAQTMTTPEWKIDAEELQRMRKTSTIIDTDVDAIVAARKKLLAGLGGEDEDVFSFLHENNIATEGKAAQDLFWEIGDAIMAMTSDAEQQTAAQKAFGKSWSELKPLFNAGREEYEQMNKSWNVVTNEQVENLTKMDDAYQKMQAEWETLQMQVLEAFSGPMTEAMETIKGVLAEVNEYLKTPEGKEALKQMGDSISGLIKDLTNISPESVVQKLKDIVDKITGALQWISDNKDTVIHAIEGIAIAFAGLKLADVAVNIGKVVRGAKDLLGLGGGGSGGGGTTGAPVAKPPVSGPTTTAGGGTGFWAAAKTGLANAAQTAAFAFPFAMFIDGMVQTQQLFDQWTEKGKESMQHTEQFTAQFKDSEMFDLWDALNDFLTISGDTGTDKAKMDKFVERYWKLWNEETQDPLMERMIELMDDEQFEKFHAAMEKYQSGAGLYSDQEISDFYDPLQAALDLIEREMEYSGGKTEDKQTITEEVYNSILGAVSQAISATLGGVQVNMDGVAVGNLVTPTVSANIAGEITLP